MKQGNLAQRRGLSRVWTSWPGRRVRHLGPWLLRRPGVITMVFLAAGLLAAAAVEAWPDIAPWSLFILIVVLAGLFLEPRHLIIVYVGLFTTMVVIGVQLGSRKAATLGTEAITLLTMLVMLWVSGARAQAGVVGVGGESMLVDMRDRLRAQGELPPLPDDWGAEAALESAHGEGFSGDFVVASRSTDGRVLEIALVDVSGKGRQVGTRSLVLSGALGGLLGEMSECGFLSSANNHLIRMRWSEGFATAVHVAVDLVTGEFTIGYAGHPSAAQFAAGSGRWHLLNGGRGPLLGVIEDAGFPRESGRLGRGDALVLYSDGVIEGRDKALTVGIDRMLGRAETFVTKGFVGLAQRLCDHALAGEGDDRAVVTIWRR